MKVMVIPSWYPPNGGYFFREHSHALSEQGAEVTVIAAIQTSLRKFPLSSPLKAFKDMETKSEKVREKTFYYWNIPVFERPNAIGWIKMVLSYARRHIKEEGMPDIVQVHSCMWAGVVAAKLFNEYGIPYVITEHRSRFVYNTAESRQMFRNWYFPLLSEAFGNAAQIITVSKALNNRIKHYAEEKGKNILSVSNMVDVEFFTPSPPHIKGNDKHFTFFALAIHISLKGFDTLLDAFAIVQQAKPGKVKLIIGGHGPQTEALKEQCQNLNLQGEVTFTGALNRQQVRENMQKAGAFVLPSRFEAFGVVFIEAMACGIPVIAARAGGPETFIPNHAGFVVSHSNHQELAQAMLSISDNPEQFSSDEIRKYAVENFSKRAVAQKYIEVYNNVLNTSQT